MNTRNFRKSRGILIGQNASCTRASQQPPVVAPEQTASSVSELLANPQIGLGGGGDAPHCTGTGTGTGAAGALTGPAAPTQESALAQIGTALRRAFHDAGTQSDYAAIAAQLRLLQCIETTHLLLPEPDAREFIATVLRGGRYG